APRRLDADARETLFGLAGAVTELMHSRQRMNALNDEHRRVLDFGRASGDWLWETDADLRTTWVSSAFEAMTGLSPDAVIGRAMPDQPLLDAHGVARPRRGTLGDLL